VRGETGRHEPHRRRGRRRADGPELLQLVLERQAVPALCLCRGRAVSGHRRRARQDVPHELLLGGLARGADGRGDPAAGRGDLLVRLPLQAAVELRLAEAGEGDVRVRVDEAGDGGRAVRVDVVVDLKLGREVALAADEGEAAVLDHQHRAVEHAQLAHGPAAGGGGAEGRRHLGEVSDQ
jgi:hypothetical protein